MTKTGKDAETGKGSEGCCNRTIESGRYRQPVGGPRDAVTAGLNQRRSFLSSVSVSLVSLVSSVECP